MFFQSARDDRGASLVEFAFAGPIFLFLLLGIVEFGRALYDYNLVANGARLGARYAAVRGTTCDATKFSQFTNPDLRPCPATVPDISKFVQDSSPGVSATDLTVNSTWANTPICPASAGGGGTSYPNGNGQGCTVTVTVSYSFNFVGLPFGTVPMASSSSLAITQ